MAVNKQLPGYQTEFGNLDYRQSVESRSVYSPAAYLADLLQLIEDHVEGDDLVSRRPDLKGITLDGKHTFSMVPYLGIVNELLESRVTYLAPGATADETLMSARHPVNLPYDQAHEDSQRYLNAFEVRPEEVYQQFSTKPDAQRMAQLALGLTDAAMSLVLQDNTSPAVTDESLASIKTNYGLEARDELNKLTDVSVFLTSLDIERMQLHELLFQNLSDSEEGLASEFFIHKDLDGYVVLNQEEDTLVWHSQSEESDGDIPNGWFDRTNRLVRLSRHSGIDLSELDLILRSCTDAQLNEEALRCIVFVTHLSRTSDLAIDVVCSLLADINTLGFGVDFDEPPVDLFNRTFNSRHAALEGEYLKGSAYIPAQYKELLPMVFSSDPFSTVKPEVLRRFSRVLHLSESDLSLIAGARIELVEQIDEDESSTVLGTLSLYHRFSIISHTLEWSISDLLLVLKLLERDPWIRRYSNYTTLLEVSVEEFDCLRILANGSVQQRLWLVQFLFGLSEWMKSSQFSPVEIGEILSSQQDDDGKAKKARQQIIDGLDGVVQAMLPVLPSVALLSTLSNNQRLARVLYETLLVNTGAVLSSIDNRLLLTASKTQLTSMARQLLIRYRQVNEKDFLDIGIHELLREKLYDNLILNDLISVDGKIADHALIVDMNELIVSRTYDSIAVFDIIAQLQRELAGENEYDTTEGVTVLPSDFDVLEISDAAQQELYSNLVFNRIIDNEGDVTDAEYFLTDNNRYQFNAECSLADAAPAIHQLLSEKKTAFEGAECRIEVALFSELGLAPIELTDLLENLRFNDYLDASNVVVNKQDMLELDVENFSLVLQFYPHRRRVLELIKSQITMTRVDLCAIRREDLDLVARQHIASSIISALEGSVMQEGIFVTNESAFGSADAIVDILALPRHLDENNLRIVAQGIEELRLDSQQYVLHAGDFTTPEFEQTDVQDLLAALGRGGFTESDGILNAQQQSFFLNINNALTFELDGYQDLSKDIFFAVHTLATRMAQSIDELILSVSSLTLTQEQALLATLSEFLEVDTQLCAVICGHVFGGSENLVEAFVAPLLSAIDASHRLHDMPGSPAFNASFQRIRQFAILATRLGLSATEADIIFHDQSLVEKYAENLVMPDSIDSFDFLLSVIIEASQFSVENEDGLLDVILLYSADVSRYWLYDARSYALLADSADLTKLIPGLAIQRVDAGFNDVEGNAWLLTSVGHYMQEAGQKEWRESPLTLGQQSSAFETPRRIDAAFVDQDSQIYLFAGDQYLRSATSLLEFDEGYPRQVAQNWAQEHTEKLPAGFESDFDAAFVDKRGSLHVFKDHDYGNSDNLSDSQGIADVWGKLRNNFEKIEHVDAAMPIGDRVYFFCGDQVLSWSSSIESATGLADVGSIQLLSEMIPGLPAEFNNGIDAVFRGFDDQIRVFRGSSVVTLSLDFAIIKPIETIADEKWGAVPNSIAETGKVLAAFSGLDGRAYVFGDKQFVRYSDTNRDYVDEGYPRSIAGHWGGLSAVNAAFILDGKTYLVGLDAEGKAAYVCYSTSDYTKQDQLVPEIADEQWWRAHFNLIDSDFADPDCVFISADGVTYFFRNDEYIAYDNLHCWWSKPAPISSKWVGMPFGRIDAAYTDKDSRTWFFSDSQHACYSDPRFNQIDARYPIKTVGIWGNVRNHLFDEQRVDAALVVPARDGNSLVKNATYLFSGDQYVRYSSHPYNHVDEGYPRSISREWSNEPCMKNGTGLSLDRIDAAYADRRNVYLFKEKQCRIVSDALSARYTVGGETPADAVIPVNGVTYIQNAGGWRALQGLESESGPRLHNTGSIPAVLKSIPEHIRKSVSAAFIGTDGVQYSFSKEYGLCYNSALNRSYPTGEEWGRIRSSILKDRRIDAAFVGTDGKTYLFRADQFLSYTGKVDDGVSFSHVDADRVADSLPKSINNHWGELESVNVAFVRDGKTYLLEHPDVDGQFRYITYSTSDYTKPDHPASTVGISWWEFPQAYLEEGFTAVDSVLIDDEHVYLFYGDSFIQFNTEEELWTYPRPVDRLWGSLPFGDSLGEEGLTAFTSIDGTTWFFSGNHVAAYAKTNSKDPIVDAVINEQWMGIRNNITQTNTVDAAVVLPGQITYLFSGDQFVRYTGTDYRYIDEGYPRYIGSELRLEPAFANLPSDIEREIGQHLKDGGRLGGVIADERQRVLFSGNTCYVVSKSVQGQLDIDRLGRLRNVMQSQSRVDAAFVDLQGQAFLFAGDQYVRYSSANYNLMDSGYPKSIHEHFPHEPMGLEFDPLLESIDAAVQIPTGELRVFAADNVYSSLTLDTTTPLESLIALSVKAFPEQLDAAFVAADGEAYFFSGSHYIRYAQLGNEFVDEGFPRAIRNNWGNLDPSFEASIDSAFVFEGRTYFVKGNQYVHVDDAGHQKIVASYPQDFQLRWGHWNDYLFTDLKTIFEFKAATSRRSANGQSLVTMLDPEVAYVKKPYELLAVIYGWPIEQIKWLKRHNAFLPENISSEKRLSIELVLSMAHCFSLATRFRVTPQELYESLFALGLRAGELPAESADYLKQWLAQRTTEQGWEEQWKRLRNDANEQRNSALLPFVVSRDDSVDNSGELFAQLLIDVEMGGEAETSRVKEATAAIQLYLHRYFSNLETLELKGRALTPDKSTFKHWWSWLQNYRVWEANRKVFLYPENYIQPELRDSRSDAFKSLEQSLLQGDVSNERITTAFNDYMNEFSKVGNLRITGANVYTDPTAKNDQTLILFGHSRSEPRQYYYRYARFTASGRALWESWIPMEINIESSRVFPVFAFGRVLLFWTEIEAFEEAAPVIQTKGSAKSDSNSTSTIETSDTVLSHRATVKYSFYDFNKHWINPQTLTHSKTLKYRIDAMFADGRTLVAFSGQYCLRSTDLNPQGTIKLIASAYTQIPPEFHSGIDAAVLFSKQLFLFKNERLVVLADSGEGLLLDNALITTYFQSVEKSESGIASAILELGLLQSTDGGFESGVSAAFLVKSNNQLCLIDKQGLPKFFHSVPKSTNSAQFFKEQILEDVNELLSGKSTGRNALFITWFRILTRNLLRLEPIDAVFEDELGIIYVLRQGQYECYRYANENLTRLEPLDGYPKPIRGNLSFNMDKFFDKLHVVQDVEDNREIVELTYSSPEANNALLTGKVLADLTFHESKLTIKSQLADVEFKPPQPPSLLNRSDYIRESGEFPDAAGVFDEAVRKIDVLVSRRLQKDKLQSFLDVIQEFVDEQPEDVGGGRIKADDSLKVTVDAASDQDPVLGLEQVNLAKNISKVIEDFKRFDNGRSETRILEYFKQLQRSLTEAFKLLANEVSVVETLSESTLKAVQLQMIDLGERMSHFEQIHNWHTNQIIDLKNWSLFYATEPLVRQYAQEGIKNVNTLALEYKRIRDESEQPGRRFARPVITNPLDTSVAKDDIKTAKTIFVILRDELANLHKALIKVERAAVETVTTVTGKLNVLRERYYGKDDVFPDKFGIRTDTDFTFGQPDWHIFEAASGCFLCRPISHVEDQDGADDVDELDESLEFNDDDISGIEQFEIIRLNSTTIPALSRKLFAGGVHDLLSLDTQNIEELPEYISSTRGTASQQISHEPVYYNTDLIGKIQVQGLKSINGDLVPDGIFTSSDRVPGHESLDFHSANASYYWEIFFHAPFLIAQTLNRAQKFEEAKVWYEYIFDPSVAESGEHWRFLPFNKVRAAALLPDESLTAVLNESIDIADLGAEMQVYLNDPFDPHAIAGIRQIAYKKAIVMRSIDNLLDWGDVLFGQYTMESINEARMLYMLAYDLLGEKPEELRRKRLAPAQTYEDLLNPSEDEIPETDSGQRTSKPDNDLLLGAAPTTELDLIDNTVHRSVRSEYFHIPENTQFLEYWTRVEDRLYKIRNSLNISGLRQALPLFQPPIDPMSIVQSVAGGASLSQITGAAAVPIPHYRFSFMHYKATELIQKLNQFGNELLAAIEKGDAEHLGVMQHKQESVIIGMTSRIREAQIAEARTGLAALESSRALVAMNQEYNQGTVDDDYLDTEIVQLALMSTAVAGHVASSILKVLATFGATTPDALVGPFIMGVKFGGSNLGSSFSSASEAIQTVAEGLSVGGEILGIVSQHERLMADTKHQADSAMHELAQIDAQIKGAELQIKVAEYELEVHRKEMEHHDNISTFMKSKFSNEQLYQWLSGQLSTLYYQSYKMVHGMARSAERAFQFERGLKESDVNYIGNLYWNSQRKGLLAGESLGLDLGRMEQAYFASDSRRLEIIKSQSLMSLDPLALLRLKALGTCEFELSETLFDYDFQGHYCRQIKTIEVIFDVPEGQTVNATLTQLNHKTVMAPDAKAVKHLMDSKDLPPDTIRSDWRASQQIVLSHVDQYEKSNGMFETRLDDDRFLPFEGTGAVSKWQLTINGKRGSVDFRELLDVTLVIKYTALQGGEVFADTVRGMLKPYDTVHLIDFNYQFHQQWLAFLESPDDSFEVAVTRDMLPNMAGGRISGLFTSLDTEQNADVVIQMNDDDELELRHGNFLETRTLNISPRGSAWKLNVLGDKSQLRNVQLVVGYKALV